jgi:hypothetical protein
MCFDLPPTFRQRYQPKSPSKQSTRIWTSDSTSINTKSCTGPGVTPRPVFQTRNNPLRSLALVQVSNQNFHLIPSLSNSQPLVLVSLSHIATKSCYWFWFTTQTRKQPVSSIIENFSATLPPSSTWPNHMTQSSSHGRAPPQVRHDRNRLTFRNMTNQSRNRTPRQNT